MKKFLCVAASLLMAASLTACGSKDEGKKDDGKASESKADVVMITDGVPLMTNHSTRVHGKVSKPMVKKPVKKLSTSNRQRNQTMPTRKLSIRLLTNTKRRLS